MSYQKTIIRFTEAQKATARMDLAWFEDQLKKEARVANIKIIRARKQLNELQQEKP